MERFVAKYTDPQCTAIASAVIEDRSTGPQVVHACATGHLPGVNEPFQIPLATVYWIARKERRRREQDLEAQLVAQEPLAAGVERINRLLIEILRREVERTLIETQAGNVDLPRVRWLIRCDRELQRFLPADVPYEGLTKIDKLTDQLEATLKQQAA